MPTGPLLGISQGLLISPYGLMNFTRRGGKIPSDREFVDYDDPEIVGTLAERPKGRVCWMAGSERARDRDDKTSSIRGCRTNWNLDTPDAGQINPRSALEQNALVILSDEIVK